MISILVVFLIFSCSSIKNKAGQEEQDLFNLELKNYYKFAEGDKVLFEYISNDYLIENLKSSPEINNYISKSEVEHILKLLKRYNNREIYYNLPENFYSKNSTSINEDQMFKVRRVNISNPIVTKNGKIALIAYSYGYQDSMEGGINLYKKVDGKWTSFDSFNLWIE